tara:strand:- start:25314 stop:25517 length:204 start_codon:yes stop_codon:yes gene_type:complete
MDKVRAWVEYDLGVGLEDIMSITADAITYADWQMEEIGKAFNAIYSIVNGLNKQALELQKEWESDDQ